MNPIYSLILRLIHKYGVVALVGQNSEFLRVVLDEAPVPSSFIHHFPEAGLHPLRQMDKTQDFIRIGQRPTEEPLYEDGILFCTHSPYMLDGLEYEQVIICHDGKWKQLSEHPRVGDCKGILSAGELWTLESEEWVCK